MSGSAAAEEPYLAAERHSAEECDDSFYRVPRYEVDLDLSAKERWRQVADDYKEHVCKVRKVMDALVKDTIGRAGMSAKSLVTGILKMAKGMVYYREELQAISELTEMPMGELILMQLIYEVSALCTSVVTVGRPKHTAVAETDSSTHIPATTTEPVISSTVSSAVSDSKSTTTIGIGTAVKSGIAVESESGSESLVPLHIRTMDWEMDFLRPLTIEVVFTRSRVPICRCTTWAGYVGVLTGVSVPSGESHGGVSVSVNFRLTDKGTFWMNFKRALTGSWPIGFLVRELLTDSKTNCDFARVVSNLCETPLIAPTYFTVAGSRPHEGVLITRDREPSPKSEEEIEAAKKKKKKKKKTTEETEEKRGIDGSVSLADRKALYLTKSTVRVSSLYSGGCVVLPVLVQPNMDHWSSNPFDDVMQSKARRSFVKQWTHRRIKHLIEARPMTTLSAAAVSESKEEETSGSVEVDACECGAVLDEDDLWEMCTAL